MEHFFKKYFYIFILVFITMVFFLISLWASDAVLKERLSYHQETIDMLRLIVEQQADILSQLDLDPKCLL